MDLEEIQEELKRIFPNNAEGSEVLLKCMQHIFDKSKHIGGATKVKVPIYFITSIAYLADLPSWKVSRLKKKFIEELKKKGINVDGYRNTKKIEDTNTTTTGVEHLPKTKKTDAKYSAKEVGDIVLKMISLVVLIKKEGYTKMTKELLERCGIPKEVFVDIVKNNEELKKYLNNLIIKNKSKK